MVRVLSCCGAFGPKPLQWLCWFQSHFSMRHCSILNFYRLPNLSVLLKLPAKSQAPFCQDNVTKLHPRISIFNADFCGLSWHGPCVCGSVKWTTWALPWNRPHKISFLYFPPCLAFQRDEAKCPSLPHSCTCTQDSIGPQGPPGPSVFIPPRLSPSPLPLFPFMWFLSSFRSRWLWPCHAFSMLIHADKPL